MIKKLKEKRIALVLEYVDLFEKKHNTKLEYWVSDNIGGLAGFSNILLVSFDDIIYDIEHEVEPMLIFEWSSKSLEHHPKRMNFQTYAKGLRFEQI